MVKIDFNPKLFDTHIKKITLIIKKKIDITLKRFYTYKETIDCLIHLSNEKEIKNLLSANVEQLRLYKDFFRTNFPSSVDIDSQLNKLLRDEIFEKEYDNWCNRTTYGAYRFVKELDLRTCPYCNRNYTFTVVNANGKMRPQIDHFYPKSKYPFFAMSFYNLIPSCPSCNHTKKENFSDDLINPYVIKNKDISFTYKPNNIEFIDKVKEEKYNFDSFDIEISGNSANIEIFKLKELYKQHKDIVLELLIKKAYYPKSYIEELSKFGFSEDEIYRYLFSNYKDKDLHKRPLSKLIKDISSELGI